MTAVDMFSQFGSVVATAMFGWAIFERYFPAKLRNAVEFYTSRYTHKFGNYFSPYITITFDEYTIDHFYRSELYTAIENYLGDKSSMQAMSMKADYIEDGKSLLLSLGEDEEVFDEYQGVKVWWSFNTELVKLRNKANGEKRYYELVFHNRHRNFILDSYLPYVVEEGEGIAVRKRTRKLFTNAGVDASEYDSMWNDIEFKHPASFDMLAMEETKKQMIIEDLEWFQNANDYYAQIGKPWKRGYLLYGPPGTGKSTLVAAMANLLKYDIYDLELTTVDDNIELRKLLIETSSKSIILIEDIDCSLDLTGERKKKEKKNSEEGKKKEKGSEVTLSGLLNFIDGIWSACGEEKIIVFTTNHIDKLDPALIRRGRMDVHVELSYCRFDSFKVLARNYLKLESHPLFEKIGRLLEETDMIPADVAENLMPRSVKVTADDCLENSVEALEKAKEEAKLKNEAATKLKKQREVETQDSDEETESEEE